MTDARIEVRGADRLARTMRAAGRDLADLSAANKDAAGTVRQAAVNRAPVRTGALRSSIRADGTPTDAVVTAGAVYAGVIEYGWPRRNITAAGYLRDGLDTTQPATLRVYVDALGEALDHVKGI